MSSPDQNAAGASAPANATRRSLVVSAVNLVEGGPLTVLREFLDAATRALDDSWRIVALVHDRRLIANSRVECIEFPEAKHSWLRRLYLEFVVFHPLSVRLNADVWLSIHDISARVHAGCRAVYCHNPAPFYRIRWREAWREPRFLLFNLFYGLLYRLNLRANDLVIVQQAWLRQIFLQRFGARCVAVAHPVASAPPPAAPPTHPGRAVFFYPTLPRVHKNVETLAEAARLLAACRPDLDFEVRLTITGDENRYAAWLRRRFGDVGPLRFVGRLDRVAMAAAYRSASMLVFPSRLETWGLPITEARSQGLPILAADLPYAHETVGDYDRVRFFAPEDAAELADLMAEYIEGTLRFESHGMPCPAEPFAEDWDALVNMLVTLADGKARR